MKILGKLSIGHVLLWFDLSTFNHLSHYREQGDVSMYFGMLEFKLI